MCQPFREEGLGAPEVLRVDCSSHPAQLVSQGSHPGFPSAFQNCGAQIGAYMLGRGTGETEALE